MLLKARNLVKKYGEREVVSNLSLDIKPAQILGLLGPNGAGKSTIIKMLSGQIKPTSGEIEIDDQRYDSVPAKFRGKIGVMPQELIVWDDLNILENIYFTGRLQGMSDRDIKPRVQYLVEGLDLTRELKTLARDLSGGYQRRLNLAISIIHKPSLIFLDEPTPGIDPQSRRFLMDFIGDLRSTGEFSMVLTDHYLDEAEKLSDYVIIIDRGKLIAAGTVPELKRQYGNGNAINIDFTAVDIENEERLQEIRRALKPSFGEMVVHKHSLTAVVTDPAEAIKTAISQLEAISVAALNITVKEPTLEDIFLILTGKEIRI